MAKIIIENNGAVAVYTIDDDFPILFDYCCDVKETDNEIVVVIEDDINYTVFETTNLVIEHPPVYGPPVLDEERKEWITMLKPNKVIFKVTNDAVSAVIGKGTMFEKSLLEKYPQLKD